jgi:hypothetical protein
MIRAAWLFITCGVAATWVQGCTTAQTTNTARTATEQLLVSNAVDYSLDKVDFRPFAGQSVYLEEKYIDCVDKSYVIASLRHRLLAAGAKLADKPESAEIVVEARSGGVGTITSQSFVGVPEIVLPGMITLPEVRLMTRTRQEGTAKIGIAAYDAQSRQALGPGGQALASVDDANWYVAGVGPWRSGLLKQEIARGSTGRAAMSQTRIPPYVTFQSPGASPATESTEPGRIQITGGTVSQPAPPAEGAAVPRPAPPAGDAPWVQQPRQ